MSERSNVGGFAPDTPTERLETLRRKPESFHQRLTLALCFGAALFVCGATVHADVPAGPAPITSDAVVVRFHSPETGGAARPRYVTARALAYEARLVALELAPDEPDASVTYDDRNVRAALDQIVAEEMLAKLPLEREPDVPTLDRVAELLRDATRERVGGPTAFDRASATEGLGPDEVQAIMRRRARAAMYVDRVIGSVLHPSEEQLREVYRTTAHPYRAKRFDDCHDELTRWIVLERVRAAETAFLQSARARVTIVYTGGIKK